MAALGAMCERSNPNNHGSNITVCFRDCCNNKVKLNGSDWDCIGGNETMKIIMANSNDRNDSRGNDSKMKAVWNKGKRQQLQATTILFFVEKMRGIYLDNFYKYFFKKQ